MLANVECAQPPTTEEALVPVGVVSVAVESAGKSADVPSAVPPEQPSVVVMPTTEGLAHSTTALEPPAENTTVAVMPAAEIPVRQATTATEPSEQPAPPVEVPTKETPASDVLEETPNSEKHTAGEPEALLAPATLTEERPDAREPAGLTVETGTAAAPVSPGSSYTEDTDVTASSRQWMCRKFRLRQVWALWSSDLHRPR